MNSAILNEKYHPCEEIWTFKILTESEGAVSLELIANFFLKFHYALYEKKAKSFQTSAEFYRFNSHMSIIKVEMYP